MQFKQYPSIENSYRKKFLDKVLEEGHGKTEYIVQEKIHGANFSFWIDQNNIQCAKRSSFIKDDDRFFNFQDVKSKYEQKMRDLFQSFYIGGASEVIIYGELYGGIYPHSDIKKSNQTAVQKGVYYNPTQDFIAFDLKVDGQYMSVDFANEIFKKFQIPHAQTLFRGSLVDCLEYPNEYITTLPQELGLPTIPNNICEGNVIRPIDPIFMYSGERLILKNKNDKFKEKHGNYQLGKKPRVVKEIASELIVMINKAQQFINDNRLRNVISKVGTITDKDFGKLMGLFTKDIIEDFTKDNDAFFILSKTDRGIITKRIGQDAALLVRQNFLNIIDGEF